MASQILCLPTVELSTRRHAFNSVDLIESADLVLKSPEKRPLVTFLGIVKSDNIQLEESND